MGKRRKEKDARRTRASASYQEASRKARELLDSPDKLKKLVDEAGKLTQGRSRRQLTAVWGMLLAMLRMLKAYANGSYRDVSWQSLLLIVAAIIYFVSPVDLIPDFILGIGFLDDAGLLAWTIKACAEEIEAFREWESSHGGPPPLPGPDKT